MSATFFGKYRGVVTNNVDPMQMGRIKALVPDVFGAEESGFAMPSVPCHLPTKIASALPKIGAAVWIEFEQGDPGRPIWTGCFFPAATQTPSSLRNRK